MKTKDKILYKSIELFNQSGSQSVSTNHIAEALGISIGNLYYHFKSKEEIIRAILDKIDQISSLSAFLEVETPETLSLIQRIFEATFRIQYEFRFFHNEIVSLLKNDPLLRTRYEKFKNKRFVELQQLVKNLIQSGTLQDIPFDSYHNLLEAEWLILSFWLPKLEMEGKALHESEIKRGIIILFELFLPYTTEKGKEEYHAWRERWQPAAV
ncbi:MAG TPA: hypothetical protein DCM08_10375 [Microscillaceae bacterium]|jgi:AcrR family transcriptional regulator|nr:hypothetical protein [Microscillaceae bacterium]